MISVVSSVRGCRCESERDKTKNVVRKMNKCKQYNLHIYDDSKMMVSRQKVVKLQNALRRQKTLHSNDPESAL